MDVYVIIGDELGYGYEIFVFSTYVEALQHLASMVMPYEKDENRAIKDFGSDKEEILDNDSCLYSAYVGDEYRASIFKCKIGNTKFPGSGFWGYY